MVFGRWTGPSHQCFLWVPKERLGRGSILDHRCFVSCFLGHDGPACLDKNRLTVMAAIFKARLFFLFRMESCAYCLQCSFWLSVLQKFIKSVFHARMFSFVFGDLSQSIFEIWYLGNGETHRQTGYNWIIKPGKTEWW